MLSRAIDLQHRDFVALAFPWLAISVGILLEVLTLFVFPVAPIWILIHFVLNPLAYLAASVVSLAMFRGWRAARAATCLVVGIALCALLIYHSVTGEIWPYTLIKPHW